MDEWVAGVMQDGNHMSISSEVTEDWKDLDAVIP